MYRIFALVLLIGALTMTTNAQDSTLDAAKIDDFVLAHMEAYDVPGVSLAIVDDGAVVYTQGYGVRSVDTGEPVTPETQFNIGSVTKSFTALAIAQQVDAGVLDLDAPITDYLPDFQLSEPGMTEKLTLRALLSNAAGFAPDDAAWYGGHLKTMAEAANYVQTLPVTSTPGTTYAYNNLGYALAGYVLEQAAGQTWSDVIRENIFTPLGMDAATTSFDEMQQTGNYVVPHVFDLREGAAKTIPFFPNMTPIAPAGVINASALEMANYANMQLGNGDPIVSEAMLAEMHTEQVRGYGLGWVPAEYEGYSTVWHNGSIDGFGALVVLMPSENLGVVALMNADYIEQAGFLDALVYRVLEIALGIEPQQDIVETLQQQTGLNPDERRARVEAAQSYEANPAGYEAYIGMYDSPYGELRAELRDERLYLVLNLQGYNFEAELLEFEPNRFIANARGISNSVFEIRQSEDGTVTISQDGTQIAQKLAEGAEAAVYTDPENRFQVDVPAGWSLETTDNMGVMTSAEQAGTFAVGAVEAGEDLQADAAAIAENIGTLVSGDPVATNPIPLPNGQQWAQYVWVTENGEVLAVNVYAEDGITYFITVQAGQADIQNLLTPLNGLLLTFSLTPPSLP
jgi:CubicO group peptidase (beta-lactamase class C family)